MKQPPPEAQLAEAMKALEAFADVIGEGAEDYADETPVKIIFGAITHYSVTLGDFRAACRILTTQPAAPQEPDFAIVRVEEACDGLHIHPDDAKKLGLIADYLIDNLTEETMEEAR